MPEILSLFCNLLSSMEIEDTIYCRVKNGNTSSTLLQNPVTIFIYCPKKGGLMGVSRVRNNLIISHNLGGHMSKSISVKLLSVLLLVGVMLGLTSVSIMQDDTVVIKPDGAVKIGLSAALSGEGLAPLGIDIQRGAELALAARPVVVVDDVEFAVVLDPQDSMCSPEGGQAVANRFTADSAIIGVVGPMCSSACIAAMPIYDSAGYSTLSPSCTAPVLTRRESPSFNRAVLSDGFQGTFAAHFIFEELGVTKIATLHDGSTYGEGLVEVVSEIFVELGGEVVAADAVTVGDTDFRALLEDIALQDPELIYFGGFPAEASRLIQQRADAGMSDVIFMGADGIKGVEVVELAGAAAEGVYASAPIPASSESMDEFLELYVEAYGEEPPAPFHANSYDATNLFLDAIEATAEVDDDGNLVISRAAIAEYLRTFTDFQGLTGILNADGVGETSVADVGFFQVKDGAFAELMVYSVTEEEEE